MSAWVIVVFLKPRFHAVVQLSTLHPLLLEMASRNTEKTKPLTFYYLNRVFEYYFPLVMLVFFVTEADSHWI